MRRVPSLVLLLALSALLLPFQNCSKPNAAASGSASSANSTAPNPSGSGPNLQLDPPLRMAPADYSSLRAAHSGRCASVRGGATATNTTLEQFICTGSAFQNFQLKLANGGYLLFDGNSGKCLKIKDASLDDNAQVVIGLCDYYAREQIFNFTLSERGFFQLVNANSGKCLSVRDGSADNGADIEQATCGGAGDRDKFYLAGAFTASVSPCENEFCAYYYDDQDFSQLALVRNEYYPINYDFGGESVDISIVGEDTFSTYYVGRFDFEAANYEFTVTADDGVRLLVDGVAVIDQYFDQAPTTYTAIVPMTAGFHKVEIYYYENGGGAVIQSSWLKQ